MFNLTWIDWLGIIGLLGVGIPYLMALFRKWKVTEYKFFGFNLIGGTCLFINGLIGFIGGYMLFIYPLLNIIWAIGTIIQLAREIKRRKRFG